MKPQDHASRLSIDDLNRLHDAALRRAGQLRDEAIDDFWRGANAALWGRLSSASRAATRFAQRLQHHRQLRSTPPARPAA
jgi:hypothetical protein